MVHVSFSFPKPFIYIPSSSLSLPCVTEAGNIVWVRFDMHFSRITLAGLASSHAAAVTLWATAYNGGVFSLNLEQGKGGYTLTGAAIPGGSTACGIDASWSLVRN
jgi:hypothetical protein